MIPGAGSQPLRNITTYLKTSVDGCTFEDVDGCLLKAYVGYRLWQQAGMERGGREEGRRQPQLNRILSFCHRSGKIPQGGNCRPEAALSGLRLVQTWVGFKTPQFMSWATSGGLFTFSGPHLSQQD